MTGAIPPPPDPALAAAIPPPPKLDEIDRLIPPSLRYQKGKGGLKAVAVPDGVIVVMFNDKDLQRRFSRAAKDWIRDTLLPNYPAASQGARVTAAQAQAAGGGTVPDTFGAEGERERLALGMRSRLTTVVEAEPGRFVGLESLDRDTGRTIPADPAAIAPENHKTLPRHVTWVQLEPPPARRYIAMSEQSMEVQGHRRRPDEIFVSYEVGDDELSRISQETTDANGRKIRVDSGTSFRDLTEVDAKNLRIHVGDPNLEIGETDAKKHFQKTLSYLQATLDTLTKGAADMPKLNLPPGSKVHLSARDVYMSHAFLKLSSVGPSVARWVRDMGGIVRGETVQQLESTSVIHFEAVFERTNKGWTHVRPKDIARAAAVRGKLGKAKLAGLLGTLRQVLHGDTVDTLLDTLRRNVK